MDEHKKIMEFSEQWYTLDIIDTAGAGFDGQQPD